MPAAVTEIVIYTPDHPGLFSRLAGAISVSGGSIVDAKIFTTSDGFALDVFWVQDGEGGPFGDGGRVERLRQTIARTLAGEIQPRAVLAKRPQGKRAAAFKTRLTGAFRQRGLHCLDGGRSRKPGPRRACSTTSRARCSKPA